MNGNIPARILVYTTVLALIMPMASAAIVPVKSGTYFYTGEYFNKTFGSDRPVMTASPKSGTVIFTDSEAFSAKFGVLSSAEKPAVEELPLEPAEAPAQEEKVAETKPADANGTAGEVEIIVVPVMAEAFANGTDNGTGTVTENGTEGTGNGTGEAAENGAGLEAELFAEPEAEDIVTGEIEAGVEDAGTLAVEERPSVSESPSGAAVAEGVPLQIAIIGLLITVIVIMLAVLLIRKEPGTVKRAPKKAKPEKKPKAEEKEKDTWEEGSFFKEAAEKREAKKDSGQSEKRDVKPFLLKIKDEV